jgi:hypothetical protein
MSHIRRATTLSEVQRRDTLALTIFREPHPTNAWRTFDVVSAHHSTTRDDFSAHFRCGFGAPLNKWSLSFRRTRTTKKVRRNDIKSAPKPHRNHIKTTSQKGNFRGRVSALLMSFRRTFFVLRVRRNHNAHLFNGAPKPHRKCAEKSSCVGWCAETTSKVRQAFRRGR